MSNWKRYILIPFFVWFSVCTASEPIDLNDAIDQVLERNPDLLQAERKLKAANARVWSKISPENPHAFIEYEGIPDRTRALSDYEEKKIGIAQSIEFPLIYYYRGRGQVYQAQQTEAEFLAVKNNVVFETKRVFYKLLFLAEKKKLFEELSAITGQLYEKSEIRVRTGDASPYETLKVKVELAETENKLLQVLSEIKNTELEFGNLIGENTHRDFMISGSLQFEPYPFTLDSIEVLTQQSHPKLKSSEAMLSTAKMDRNLSWLKLIPTVEIKIFQQRIGAENSQRAWGGEVGLSIPLWAGFKSQGEIRAAQYQVHAAKMNRQSTQNDVHQEIHDAWSKMIVAQKQVRNYSDNILAEVEELVRIATRSYEEGEMGYLDVMEALRTLNRTRIGYVETLYQYLVATADLERIVGIINTENQ